MEMQPQRTGGELSEMIDRYQNQVYGLALANLPVIQLLKKVRMSCKSK